MTGCNTAQGASLAEPEIISWARGPCGKKVGAVLVMDGPRLGGLFWEKDYARQERSP